MTATAPRYDDLKALFINCTLKRSPEVSNTQGLVDASAHIMRAHGIEVQMVRAIDHDIATGVWPDMREHGWASDDWPAIFEKVLGADILVLAGPIWLGDNSSVMNRSTSACTAGRPAQRRRPVHLLRPRRRMLHHRQRGRHRALRAERALHAAAHRLHDPPAGRRRLDRRGRARPVVPRSRLRRPGERLHQSQHHLHDLEPHAPGPDPEGRGRYTGLRQPALGVDAGCRFDYENPKYGSASRYRRERPARRPSAARPAVNTVVPGAT